MNTRSLVWSYLFVALWASVAPAATIVVSDDFSSASLDPMKWQTITPYAQSSVSQSDGSALITGRGILATTTQFSPPLVISGSFTMGHDLESFTIGFRTNLTPLADLDLFNTLSGMFVTFSNEADQISIQGRGYSPQNSVPGVSYKNYSLLTGQNYFFTITDDGLNISVLIDGNPELSAATNVSTGGYVAFYSREFPTTFTKIDAVSIIGQSVPEVGSIQLLGTCACMSILFLNFLRRNAPSARTAEANDSTE